MLQAHNLLLSSCATMKSCPPPAIARAVAMATGQDVQRLSHFMAQVISLTQVWGMVPNNSMHVLWLPVFCHIASMEMKNAL